MIKRSKRYIATPPGATIKEQLDDRGMTQKEFAQRMDMSEKHISHLINGEVRLTPETALRMEHVLGVPAQFWNNLEARYCEKLALIEEENAMEADIELAKKIPYAEMVKLNWISKAANAAEKVNNLRKFFGVAKLGIIDNMMIPGIAYRKTDTTDHSIYALAVWAQKAKLLACEMAVHAINMQRLAESIAHIKAMTFHMPDEFLDDLTALLAECGIALVMLPHIKGSFLQGASFYDGKKIVLGMTLRGANSDKFWFSLLHEIAHIQLGHIGLTQITQAEEDYADRFAANLLIPLNAYSEFTKSGTFSLIAITQFADEMGIHPGIVVGRLQKDGCIGYRMFQGLKMNYSF